MRFVYIMTYVFSAIFLIGENARRGFSYFSINATTMVEDYLCGALLVTAAILWAKGSKKAYKYMVAAWAYAVGGMFVPFSAHLEAFLRNTPFRPDHPITDVKSIVLKGTVWGVALICFIIVMKSEPKQSN